MVKTTITPTTVNAVGPIIQGMYTPEQLKIVVDALNGSPSYLSKRFVLKHLLGWSDKLIEENYKLKLEEDQQSKRGDTLWR